MALLKGNYKLQKTVTKDKLTEEEKLEILLEKKAHKKFRKDVQNLMNSALYLCKPL